MFGPHLIIDGTRCDTRKLGDRLLIEQTLADYPAAIGMTRIGGPYMFEYQAPDPAYSGISGIVVIAESHIAIHTFPALDYFTMDIFSCKNFDHEKAIRYIKEALDVREMDRMLVQRGLSFHGPHHGADGATDELIAAAQARLDAGIVSTETVVLPDAPAARAALVARHAESAESAGATDEAAADGAPAPDPTVAGGMRWPEYGVTPDLGTYGVAVPHPPLPPAAAAEHALPATEPVLVNPTASISGLLDKLGAVGRGGHALSRALAEWERLARDPGCAIVLTLATPVVAAGLREVLVYAVEQRYVDIVVATGEDLFADLHEALGHVHYLEGDEPTASESDRAHTSEVLTELVAALPAEAGPSIGGHDLLRALGEALRTRAQRKGLLQAAAAAGVPLYAPDLAASPFGAALVAARARGAEQRLDSLDDLAALARELRAYPRVGTLGVGQGLPDDFVAQAAAMAGEPVAALACAISIGAVPGRGSSHAAGVNVAVDPTLALPLLVSGLAQRIPAARGLRSRTRLARAVRQEERALA